MKTLLVQFFIQNWQRKALALLLGILIWLVVNHSLSSTKTINSVPVRVINVPSGKTVEGMQNGGRLSKKVNLVVVGNTSALDEMNADDLEVVIDAQNEQNDWLATISKKNIISFNPELDIGNSISKVYCPDIPLRITNLVVEEIPVIITRPIGEAPRGYQFLDVWPYEMSVKLTGPEEIINRLKMKKQRLTFNLNDISKTDLDRLSSIQNTDQTGIVSFSVPDSWKQLSLPLLTDHPIEISGMVRLDFIKYNLLTIDSPIEVSLFYPAQLIDQFNPSTLSLKAGPILSESKGIFFISIPLYAKGADRLFTQIIQKRLQILVTATPTLGDKPLPWSLQFINPSELEEEYVSTLISDVSDEDAQEVNPFLREGYLRNRFRSYMNRFELFKSSDTPFEIAPLMEGTSVIIEDISHRL